MEIHVNVQHLIIVVNLKGDSLKHSRADKTVMRQRLCDPYYSILFEKNLIESKRNGKKRNFLVILMSILKKPQQKLL